MRTEWTPEQVAATDPRAIRVGAMVSTPHASRGRLYRVLGMEEYPNPVHGQRAIMQEIGAGQPPISYPVSLLTYQGHYG